MKAFPLFVQGWNPNPRTRVVDNNLVCWDFFDPVTNIKLACWEPVLIKHDITRAGSEDPVAGVFVPKELDAQKDHDPANDPRNPLLFHGVWGGVTIGTTGPGPEPVILTTDPLPD